MMIFTGQIAFEYWKWHIRTSSNPARCKYSRITQVPTAVPNPTEAKLECEPFRESTPIEVMIHDRNQRITSKDIVCRARSGIFPSRSFCVISKKVLVISPELLFLEFASRLDFASLVLLGCELTSGFHRDTYFEDSIIRNEPLIGSNRIISYLNNVKQYRSLEKARKAADFILDNSASPMETQLALLLTIPRKHGGFGLPRPKINYEMPINRERCEGFNKSSVKFDLYWKEGPLDVEYDSDQFHSGILKLHEDSARRNAIRRHGVDVITVTSNEFRNIDCMSDLAKSIARRIGYKLPKIDLTQKAKAEDLRQRLGEWFK